MVKKKEEKKRLCIYVPKHLLDIGKIVSKSNSHFITIALEHFINQGGLQEWIKQEGTNN